MSDVQRVFAQFNASDGFFLNLSSLVVKLARPFANSTSSKLFQVDPKYCSCPLSVHGVVHINGLAEETKLSAQPDNPLSSVVVNQTDISLSTQIFFLAHRALHLGREK